MTVPVDPHQQALTRRVLATFADAWHDTDGTVPGTEALLASALRASPRDEGLLRLRAWTLSWSSNITSASLIDHHLRAWLALDGSPAGRWALDRLRTDRPDPHQAPLLRDVLPTLPVAAVPDVLAYLGDQAFVTLPWQALLLGLPGPDAPRPPFQIRPLRNAWDGMAGVAPALAPGALARNVWVNAHGAPDPHLPGRTAWWQTLNGVDPTVRRLTMATYRLALDASLASLDPGSEAHARTRQQGRDDALHLGITVQVEQDVQDPVTPARSHALAHWAFDAGSWLNDGARLPHHRQFDLPRAHTLPQGAPASLPDTATFDDAVRLMAQSTQRDRVTVQKDTWFVLWQHLLPLEQRCEERRTLDALAQAALDEQGPGAGHLRTRPRL